MRKAIARRLVGLTLRASTALVFFLTAYGVHATPAEDSPPAQLVQDTSVPGGGPLKVDLRTVARIDHPAAHSIAWSPDGRYLAATGDVGPGSTLRKLEPPAVALWDVTAARLHRSIPRIVPGSHPLAFTSDGMYVLFARPRDATIPETTAFSAWNVQTGAIDRHVLSPFSEGMVRPPPHLGNSVRRWALSVDGRYAAVVFGKHESGDPIGIYDLEAWTLLSTEIKKERWGASSLAFSPDRRHLAIGQFNGEIRIVDFGAATTTLTFKAHGVAGAGPATVTALAYSPDGRFIVSGSAQQGARRDAAGQVVRLGDDDQIRVWEAATGRMTHSYAGKFDGVTAVNWSPDGRLIASAAWDSVFRVWNASGSGPPLAEQPADRGAFAVAFSPVGDRLAAADAKQITVFDVRIHSR